MRPSTSTARGARRLVALLVDVRPDELEVEAALVARGEHLPEDALERDVAVAGDEAVRRRVRADGVVAHLHHAERVDARRDRPAETALGPARVGLDADADAEPSRQVDRVGEGVHEPDVDAQRVRVLEPERDPAGRRLGDDRLERRLPARLRRPPTGARRQGPS